MSLAKKMNKALQKNGTMSGIMSENEFAEIPYYVDTGVVGLNLLISAKCDGGIPASKMTMFAGKKSSGKSIVAYNTMKNIQEQYQGTPVLIDSEMAGDKDSFKNIGINNEEMIYLPLTDIKNENKELSIQYQVNELSKVIEDEDKSMIVLDSLGMVVTQRTANNLESNNTAKDMSINQDKKTLMSQLTHLAGRKKIPVIVINHTYDNLGGFGSATEVSGGSSLYFPSIIIEITSKANWKDETTKESVGSIFTAKVYKGRLSREKSTFKFAISYEYGLSRYFGLEDFAIEGGFIEETKEGKSTVYKLKDSELTVRKKNLHIEPTKEYNNFFETLMSNEEFKQYLNDAFAYGSSKKLKSLIIEDEGEE